jgi:hypothetical protein
MCINIYIGGKKSSKDERLTQNTEKTIKKERVPVLYPTEGDTYSPTNICI